MWFGGAGLEFRMELRPHEPRMIFDLDDFDQAVVRQRPTKNQALADQFFPEGIIELIPVAMAFIDDFVLIGRIRERARHDFAGIYS